MIIQKTVRKNVASINQTIVSDGGRLLPLFLIVAAALLLSGCWEVKREVIPASAGEEFVYTGSEADMKGGGSMYFSRAGVGNDVRFRDESKTRDTDEPNTGTFRLMRIKEDLYAVQMKYDGKQTYNILFYRITPKDFWAMEIDPEVDIVAKGQTWGVKVGADSLSGEPADMLAFLKALRSVKFINK